MKLLVIVLCLLCERFLMHSISYQRFSWFGDYVQFIKKYAKQSNPWIELAIIIAPISLAVLITYLILSGLLFGFVGLLLSVVILYYCLGPQNTFYPLVQSSTDQNDQAQVAEYFASANSQLFAVLFWFILGGPIAALIYRLFSLAQNSPSVAHQATLITQALEWVPARITALLYLLAGNFQRGFVVFTKQFLSKPEANSKLLSECGLLAVRMNDTDEVPISAAENLIELSAVVLLVFIALFTLGAWL